MKRGVCAVTILALAVAGCGGGEPAGTTGADATTQAPGPASGGEPYPASFRRDYLAECEDERGSRADCECILSELEANVPYEEYARYAEGTDAEAPAAVTAAIETCTS